MKKNSLTPNKGLSLSQAQSISNLCNQRTIEIAAKLTNVNNYSRAVKLPDGQIRVTQKPRPLPENVTELLYQKARLHACQAFLMENIKAKDAMLKEARNATSDISAVERPIHPNFIEPDVLPVVDENYGWEQLSVGEINEYIEAEAFAAHIGQFIHKDGILTRLRGELPNVPEIEWMTIKEGEKTPVNIEVHHYSEDLLKLHEELAAQHREYEQRVNYFKAKVKNLTTKRNAEIAKINADAQNEAEKQNNDLQAEYQTALKRYSERVQSIHNEFEKERQARISEIAGMRIDIDSRFQEVVNEFLTKLPDTEE
jgi:hypothetical protein